MQFSPGPGRAHMPVIPSNPRKQRSGSAQWVGVPVHVPGPQGMRVRIVRHELVDESQ